MRRATPEDVEARLAEIGAAQARGYGGPVGAAQ
jgi:hypothetical protein